jgi:hypothetical protein
VEKGEGTYFEIGDELLYDSFPTKHSASVTPVPQQPVVSHKHENLHQNTKTESAEVRE